MKHHIQITSKVGLLDLDVQADFSDEIILISGENGAGKTTLLRCLAGLQQAQGQLLFNDDVWLDSCTSFVLPSKKRKVGCLWPDTALLPWLSVEKNITLGIEQVDKTWLKDLAEKMEVLPLMQRTSHMLSTGEGQRVALARAICRKPTLLLLDEPFSAQAPTLRQRLRASLKLMQIELEIPILMVSHDVEDAETLANQHWHMREGKLIKGVAAKQIKRGEG